MSEVRDDDPDIAYFRDLERAFVERRGDPLFISNADWVFLAGLRKKGVPRRVVLRGITDAFDAHAHSFARRQKIRSLRFCENEITAAVDRYRRALRSDGPGRRGLGAALEKLEERLGTVTIADELKPAFDAARAELRTAVEKAEKDKAFEIERELAGIEDRLVATASASLDASALGELEEATRAATAAYKSRMPATVYETLIAESVRRKILQRFGVPRFLLAELE